MKHNVTINSLFFAVLLCVGLPCVSHGQDDPNAWRETYRDGKIGGRVGYGGDSVCKISKEPAADKNVLMTTFSDASPDAWAHRGVRIDFKKAVSRDAFQYIHFDYKLDRPVKAIGYFIQDDENNMWRVFSGPVITEKWSRSVVRESAFKFGWGKKPPGNSASKIVRLYLFVETPNVNTGTQFTLFVDNVALSKEAPPELDEPIDAGPIAARERYLLLDSRLIDTAENARLAVGMVTKHAANPLFGQELPWEQTIHHMYANVLFDGEDQAYKIWNFTTISGPPDQVDWKQHVTPGPLASKEKRQGNFATCYAVSKTVLRGRIRRLMCITTMASRRI